MKSDPFIRNLTRIVGEAHVSISRADAEIYSYDASLATGTPDVVVFPANTHEAAQVVRVAHDAGIPFVPRGFGTNLSGGTIPSSGGLVVCLSRLNRILAIHRECRYAVVQPGVTNLELQNALAPLGFFYAPDPASQKVATLGGNVGENSGGPRCVKYGVTTNHILGLEVVLPDGEVIETGGPALDPPGYDLRGVMVGSEGTFGIATEITVRILPRAEKIFTLLAVYDDVAQAARSVSDIISAGMVPATLEMMDTPIIKAVEDSYTCGYPVDAAAVLIIEVEGPSVGLKDQAQAIRRICNKNNCRNIRQAKDNAERNRLWEGRRGAFGAVARLAPNYLVNDCTVPRTKLPEALSKVAEITQKYGFEHGNVFHAGDGNLHPLMFFDSRDADQLKRVKKAGWEIMETCVKLGGTISGEHGIGLEKLDAMHLIFSPEDLDVQRAVKQAFDPQNRMNPGKAVPEPIKTDHKKRTLPPPGEPTPEALTVKRNAGEIIEKIKTSIDKEQAVLPMGRGFHMDFGNRDSGNRSQPPMVSINSEGLAGVIEYDPDNQVVTAGAGLSLDDLQKRLRDHDQWLPIRPPFSRGGYSMGGLVALGTCGPERMFYGAPRDLLLGLRFISGKGQWVSTGGKVVKNVAGYDMTRLMTGSAGTLGFITDATFRVSSLPECCRAITANGSLKKCASIAFEFIKSTLAPVFIALIPDNPDGRKMMQPHWKMVIGFEGFTKTCDYQSENATALIIKNGLKSPNRVDYDQVRGMFVEPFKDVDRSPFVLQADFPQNRFLDFVDGLTAQLPVTDLFIDFGCGRIFAGMADMNGEAWARIGHLSADYGGHALLLKAPDDFKKRHDVFGHVRPEWRMVHKIKAALDPHHIFSPGCLPGKG